MISYVLSRQVRVKVADPISYPEQERGKSALPVSLPLHDRSFDLVLLSNWEDKIVYDPNNAIPPPPSESNSLTNPVNKALESGAWTQSILWGPGQPFRDFTHLELDEDELGHEERPQGKPHYIPCK